ncbi:MAG TPA: hypothetical protein VFG76_01465 [Candidatus Polarisedimenticolia bacterium]|nr:hypothetical protein [Candidatus Polarisedimenticolia bacterium]
MILLAGAVVLPLGCPTATAAPAIMSFHEVRAGMKGTGRTVFSGTTIEEFGVEVIGTMENILPGKNLIMVRLQGGPLAVTGVLEGMSGSPVYLDGRLAGAVAYAWGFGKEPICGVTPIEEMLEVMERGVDLPPDAKNSGTSGGRLGEPGPVSLLAYPDRMLSFLQRQLARRAWTGGDLPATTGRLDLTSPHGSSGLPLAALRPPLVLRGFHPSVARDWFPTFESMSFRPVMAGAPAAAGAEAAGDRSLAPGSAFGATLISGDMDMSAIGTVTHVDGDKVLGMGHPFLAMGPTAMPMSRAFVHGVFPSLMSSFKIAGPLDVVGAFTQDRFAGMAGRLGQTVQMVPVRVEFRRPDGTNRSYRFDIVPDPLLTPGLLHMSLLSLFAAEEKQVGDITVRLKEGSRIQVSDDLEVKLDNLFSGDQSELYASGTVAYMTYLLLNNEERPSRIEGINLLVDFEDDRKTARIEKIWLERYTARPGETVILHVNVQPYRQEVITLDMPLKIPQEAPEGRTLLQVGDSLTLSRMESVAGTADFIPRSLDHLVWLLNHIRQNQKVYATLIRPDTGAFISGERLPNLPPSISSVILRPRAERDLSSRLTFRALLEADADTPYAIRGYQKALMEIKR